HIQQRIQHIVFRGSLLSSGKKQHAACDDDNGIQFLLHGKIPFIPNAEASCGSAKKSALKLCDRAPGAVAQNFLDLIT
ncbi:hypothetical protein RA263_29685, partial [Pseudomonas syringae pv. tagetis]|uniref:hypothetical protein n=1 Tax=Pseudomonas syringae group genomosp. 7 TaxID=251699 RepID=UPI00376FFA31